MNKTAKEEYLEFILGKKEKYSSIASKALTSYYIVIIFVGMIGNVLTAWVISISPALQTPSNYFLCNLAIVDIVTLLLGKYFYPIFMILFLQFDDSKFNNVHSIYISTISFQVLPMDILLIWHRYPWVLGHVGCGVAVIFSELVTYVSVGTIFAFTFER